MSKVTRLFRTVIVALFVFCHIGGHAAASIDLPARIGPILAYLAEAKHQAEALIATVQIDHQGGEISEAQYAEIESAYEQARVFNASLIDGLYRQVETRHQMIRADMLPVERRQFQESVEALHGAVLSAYGTDCTITDSGLIACPNDFGITAAVGLAFALVGAVWGVMGIMQMIEDDIIDQEIIAQVLLELDAARWRDALSIFAENVFVIDNARAGIPFGG